MRSGKWNVSIRLQSLAGFMVYGFVLIYLRDFAAGKDLGGASIVLSVAWLGLVVARMRDTTEPASASGALHP